MMCPAAADPPATPTEIAELSQVIPSVRRSTGAWRSIRPKPAMRVGEMATPQQKITSASDSRAGYKVERHLNIGARQVRDPYQSPPIALPSA